MITFLCSLIALIAGYFIYGKVVEKIIGVDPSKETPARYKNDGVDYVEMSSAKVLLIQFLNIAGLGPIFGAVAGALWGPAAFLWIVFGCIFAGAVHDFLSGMMSIRNDGASISEIVGKYLGASARLIMIVFSIVLLVLVGVVFVKGPAAILSKMMPSTAEMFWVSVIIVYYIIATLIPIDKIIGKIYPFFGAALIIMGIGIGVMMFFGGYAKNIPELSFSNFHPDSKSIFPFLFVTIACGAISGFHATQSPLMARCVKTEKDSRMIFYGAMIIEGIVALIWAAASMSFFGSIKALQAAGAAPVVVNEISIGMLGAVGGFLAILGVVACPITSGDTAFRSARLTIADAFKLNQKPGKNRLIIAVPLFAVGIGLCFIDFGIIWRYFAWSNQTLATVALWTGAMYLLKHGRNHWIATVPATFMTTVITSYLIVAPEGFGLSESIGLPIGIFCGAAAFIAFILNAIRLKKIEPQIS